MNNNTSESKTYFNLWKKYRYIFCIGIYFILTIVFLLIFNNNTARNHIINLFTYLDNNTILDFMILLTIATIVVLFGCKTLIYLLLVYTLGFYKGSIISIISTLIVCYLFFVGARYLFKNNINDYLKDNKNINKYLNLFNKNNNLNKWEQLELVSLSRLGFYPSMPVSLYWGVTDINTFIYLIGNLFIIPWIILITFVGKNIKSIKSIKNIKKLFQNKNNILKIIIIIIVTLIITIYINNKVKKKLEKLDNE